jgi:hypothetical protein
MRFTALFHDVDLERVRLAFHALQKNAAPGVDGVTWEQYAEQLEDNLRDLHARLHQGAYRARPSRRSYIPKADGRQRPLGIASLDGRSEPEAHLHVLRGASEPHDADVNAALHARDECPQQEVENHATAIALYLMYYDFGRIHQTLGVTRQCNGALRGMWEHRGNLCAAGLTAIAGGRT